METAAVITAIVGGIAGLMAGFETIWSRVYKARTEERGKKNAERLSEMEMVIEEYRRLLTEANNHINANDQRLDSIEAKEKACYKRVRKQHRMIIVLARRNKELKDQNARQASEILELRQHLNLPETIKGK